jgi:hypothetical protein
MHSSPRSTKRDSSPRSTGRGTWLSLVGPGYRVYCYHVARKVPRPLKQLKAAKGDFSTNLCRAPTVDCGPGKKVLRSHSPWYLIMCRANDSSESERTLAFGQARHTDHRGHEPDGQDNITSHWCSGCSHPSRAGLFLYLEQYRSITSALAHSAEMRCVGRVGLISRFTKARIRMRNISIVVTKMRIMVVRSRMPNIGSVATKMN